MSPTFAYYTVRNSVMVCSLIMAFSLLSVAVIYKSAPKASSRLEIIKFPIRVKVELENIRKLKQIVNIMKVLVLRPL